MARRSSKDWIGIKRRGDKWRVMVRIAPGTQGMRSTSFALDTPVGTMAAWRREQRGKYGEVLPAAGTFAKDVCDYIDTQRHRPSFRMVRPALDAWIERLGGQRSRSTIRTSELMVIVADWLTRKVGAPTIIRRVSTLRSFFRYMNAGTPDLVNPVDALPNCPSANKPVARGRDFALIERIIDAMADSRPGCRTPSLSKLRARVIAHTGIPPGMLKQLRATDLDLVRGRVRVVPRSKAAGVEARTLRLTPPAVEAFRLFDAGQAYGRFDVPGLNATVQRAALKVGLAPGSFRLYDLRHSFLSQLYRATRDLATVARFACHAPNSTATFRYTMAVHEEVDEAAVQAFQASVRPAVNPASPVPKRDQKQPRKAARLRKLQRTQRLATVS